MRAQLAERKPELLEYLRANQSNAANIPPINSRTGDAPAPLSFAQERLWFLEQLEPGNTAYNICRAWRVTGKLNATALEKSLNEIVRRHAVLRSAIRVNDGKPVQIVDGGNGRKRRIKRKTIDEADIQRTIQAEAERSFDFSKGQFLRAVLLRVGRDDHVVILTLHHIMADAWSMGILTRELWTLYESFASKKPLSLEEPPLQYADFAVWQREWLKGEVLDAQLAYWKKQLADTQPLNLPTDRPRPPKQTFHGARVPIALPESFTAAMNELSHACDATPFMVLLAAFQVLLYRYTGQDDIVVGSPVANRNRSELESIIGFFVNTLVLRSDLSGKPTFKECLARVRETCLGAYAHQDLPFERLVEELKPERDQSRNPLFQVMFVLQNGPRSFGDVPGLSIEPIEIESTRSQFDLSLFFREREGTYIGFIEYNTDLFDHDRIERMTRHLQTLLEGLIANPDQAIATLPILTENERQQILREWNDTAVDYPKDKCIQQLFEEQVELTPDAIAIQFHEEKLTYGELNRRANQLAHYLIPLDVGPEKLVGICVERSIEMVVSLLGILKAGGAYVPLDPAYPAERLRFMFEDAGCHLLLTQSRLVEDRKWLMEDGDPQSSILNPQVEVVAIDRDWPSISQQKEETPLVTVGSGNLAYVIYTSGSTGKPKGVAIEHRNTVNLLSWAKSVYQPSDLAGVLASTSICFDLSVFELFLPLMCGGQVILAENALRLHELASKNEITLLNTVPSVMAQLLQLGSLPESVRIVNLAGEPLKTELVNRLYEETGVDKVYDLYGPTETTTYTTFTLRREHGPETIGRPIANTQIYILDDTLRPVPVGIEGELYIGGNGVARGYLNRPELTAERFVRNPFGDEPSPHVYRTGDRACFLPDGNIRFLGRADNQVKIRGYRIELGEIETVLKQHSAVRDCVVVPVEVKEFESENPKSKIQNLNSLVAYFVASDQKSTVAELRKFLEAKLPNYMVPYLFIQLHDLPLTPNGKVDRNALTRPDMNRPEREREFIAPRTEIEELIAQAWREVLNVENLSIHDNFFDLGGHSMLGIQLVGRLRETFDREVQLSVLFSAPTVAELSIEMESMLRDGTATTLPPIVPVPRDGRPIPLSLNQEHLWRLDRMMPGTHFFNIPYVYKIYGDLNVKALSIALRAVIQRHEALRTVFKDVGGEPAQIIKDDLDIELTQTDLRDGSIADVSEAAAEMVLSERYAPFDLTSGPLVRVTILRLTDTHYYLLITIHHIISDHWSMQLLRQELFALYDACVRDSPLTLVVPQIQFADFAHWEREIIDNGLLKAEQEYWRTKLFDQSKETAKASPRHGRVRCGKPKRIQEPFSVGQGSFSEVRDIARKERITPFSILLSAISVLLHVSNGQHDFWVGVLVANRQREAEASIGYFLNTVVLHYFLTREMTWRELFLQIRKESLAAFARQIVPFQWLFQARKQSKSQYRRPMFSVLVEYQVASSQWPPITGCDVSILSWEHKTVQNALTLNPYDIVFRVTERGGCLDGAVDYSHDFAITMHDSVTVSVNEILRQMTDVGAVIPTI